MMKMKCCFISLALFALLSTEASASPSEVRQVVVSATGTVSVHPDMAEFGVVLSSDAKAADRAVAEVAEKYRAVQSALRSAGVAKDDAPTTSYTVSPRWEWDQSQGKNLLKGYSARHAVKVTVRSLEAVGRAIDAVVHAGAGEVQNISFLSSRYEALRQQALAVAVENGRRDAAIMARAAGGRLGELIEVSVAEPFRNNRIQMDGMLMKASPASAPTEIAPSELDLGVTINARWSYTATPVR